MNIVILKGRLTKDPELRQTNSGTSVCSFTVAVGDKERTEFIDCVAWKNTADHVKKWFTKGKEIALNGSLHVSEYTDKENQKRRRYEVNVFNVEFCGSATKPAVDVEFEDYDEDEAELPF